MLSCLGILIFEAAANPSETPYDEFVEVFNELNILVVGYFAVQMLYASYDPLVMHEVGLMIIYVIVGGVAVNMYLIIFNMLREIKMMCRHRK